MSYNLLIEIFILTQRDKILQNTLQKITRFRKELNAVVDLHR